MDSAAMSDSSSMLAFRGYIIIPIGQTFEIWAHGEFITAGDSLKACQRYINHQINERENETVS